jgi:hypothetical protein
MSPSPRQEIRVRLAAARRQWEEAHTLVKTWEHATGEHGVTVLHNARLQLGVAGAHYQTVLREFTEAILRT